MATLYAPAVYTPSTFPYVYIYRSLPRNRGRTFRTAEQCSRGEDELMLSPAVSSVPGRLVAVIGLRELIA